jgi:integrase/recombinase XerD
VYHLRAFEDFLRRSGAAPVQGLSPVCLSGFIAESDVRLRGSCMQFRCAVLRSFLRYLFREGILRRDLSPAVERRRSYRLAGLPRSISWPEVERVLGSIDRRTPAGKRDYAVLMLLVTYGLRAREVAALTLGRSRPPSPRP